MDSGQASLPAVGFLGPIAQAWQTAKPQVLWLIDPDKLPLSAYPQAAEAYLAAGGRWALVGGSFLSQVPMHVWCEEARRLAPLPLILFPGSSAHLTPAVDAVLFLFLASGRNPQYLIGHQVEAAPHLYRWGLEVIPTTYLLLGSPAHLTAAHYITQTMSLPPDKLDLIEATALAGLFLGQRALYLDAGSGASSTVSPSVVQALRRLTRAPILVGGGIQTPAQAHALLSAGASFVVIGTLAEKSLPSLRFWEEFFAFSL